MSLRRRRVHGRCGVALAVVCRAWSCCHAQSLADVRHERPREGTRWRISGIAGRRGRHRRGARHRDVTGPSIESGAGTLGLRPLRCARKGAVTRLVAKGDDANAGKLNGSVCWQRSPPEEGPPLGRDVGRTGTWRGRPEAPGDAKLSPRPPRSKPRRDRLRRALPGSTPTGSFHDEHGRARQPGRQVALQAIRLTTQQRRDVLSAIEGSLRKRSVRSVASGSESPRIPLPRCACSNQSHVRSSKKQSTGSSSQDAGKHPIWQELPSSFRTLRSAPFIVTSGGCGRRDNRSRVLFQRRTGAP